MIGDTIRVSNLDPSNGEEELRYIFENCGPITKINIYYDQTGRSTGTAEVQFGSNLAAETAVKQLDQAEVNGRLMFVQLVGQFVQSSVPIVQPRREVGGGADRPQRRDGGDRRQGGQQRGNDRREGGRDGGNERRQGRPQQSGEKKGRQPRQERKPATAEDLDADMEDYHKSKPQASEGTTQVATSNQPSNEETPAAAE